MVASFEDSEGGPAAKFWLHRVGQPRQVVVDELVLQRQRGGGDHHRSVDQQGRNQVRE